MKITEITSILAILLSVFNTFLIIKRDFMKKEPSLEIEIGKAQMRYAHNETQAQVLLDLCMIPRERYNGIKKIYFCISEKYYISYNEEGLRRRFLKYVDNFYGRDVFSEYNYQDYFHYVVEGNKEHMKEIVDLEAGADIPIKFSLTEQFDGFQWSDGYDKFPSKGATLHITDYFGKEYVKEIKFDIV